MDVLTSDVPALDAMQPLPPGIRLVHEPGPGIPFAVFGPELLEQVLETVGRLPDLEVLQTASAGLDSVLPHVPSRVTVCGASGAHDVAVSEWVMAGLLAATRRLIPFYDAQREGRWERDEDDLMGVSPGPIGPVEDLEGATVLVIGYGSIGRAVGRRLEPFGAHVVGVTAREHDDTVTIDRLPDLLPEAAAVVLLTPLTEATRGMVDDAFLTRMRQGAVLVNAARGPVIDTDALIRALATRRIHAVLDVTDPEPLPHGHALWSAPNVLITPHVAGTTTAWLRRAYRLAGEQLRRYVAGEPLANAQPGRA